MLLVQIHGRASVGEISSASALGMWEHLSRQGNCKSSPTSWKDTHGISLAYMKPDGRILENIGLRKDIFYATLENLTISSRLISIRLWATPFNITVVQAYAPTTDYDDDQVEEFYAQLQNIADQVDKKDILVIQGDWNAKVGADALKDWKNYCGPSCNDSTNERELRMLEFASYNNMVLGEHPWRQEGISALDLARAQWNSPPDWLHHDTKSL